MGKTRWLGGRAKAWMEREIKVFDRQIKEVRKAALAVPTLEEKLAGQKQIKALESERGKRRKALLTLRTILTAAAITS